MPIQSDSTVGRPFRQQAFSDLPEFPRRAHPYFTATAHDIDVDSAALGSVRTHYREYGVGAPLLLVHGLMTSGYSWRDVLDGLGARYRLVIPDLPGAGRSGIPAQGLSAPRLAAWIADFQSAIGIRGCPVVGNSLGGYLVMRQALADPGAFSKVVTIHAPAFPQVRLHALRAVLSVPRAGDILGWWIRRDTQRWAHQAVHYYDDAHKSREEMREYGDPLRTVAGTRAFADYLREVMSPHDFAEFIALLERQAAKGVDFPVPLQLIYSCQDPLVSPTVGARLAELIPNARLRWVDRSSHFVQVDSPGVVVSQVLEFLDTGNEQP
ncbi:alpha/beta fold hydrolase [Nocardia sp. NPDC058658]|uniref:alpha/beta fold hydrolase n=1 Tax=Nocardia sp. NPDC058658 TaxID=3346580 RepID=UPI0036665FE6